MQHLYDLFVREMEDFQQEAAAAEGRFKTKLGANEKKTAEAAAAAAAPSRASAAAAAASAAAALAAGESPVEKGPPASTIK